MRLGSGSFLCRRCVIVCISDVDRHGKVHNTSSVHQGSLLTHFTGDRLLFDMRSAHHDAPVHIVDQEHSFMLLSE